VVVTHAAQAAAADASFDKNAYIGAFYGSYFSGEHRRRAAADARGPRLVKRFAWRRPVRLPFRRPRAYGSSPSAHIAIVRWAKTARTPPTTR